MTLPANIEKDEMAQMRRLPSTLRKTHPMGVCIQKLMSISGVMFGNCESSASVP